MIHIGAFPSSHFKQLKKLKKLRCCFSTNIYQFSQLQALHIINTPGAAPAAENIEFYLPPNHLPQLQTLEIDAKKLTLQGALPVNTLRIHLCEVLQLDALISFEHLANLTFLECFYLDFTALIDFFTIENFPQLKTLTMRFNKHGRSIEISEPTAFIKHIKRTFVDVEVACDIMQYG